MKKLAFFLLFSVIIASCFAQEQPAKPTAEQYEKAIPIILAQRNQLSTAVLDAQTQLQLLAAENEALKKQVAELSAKLSDATKPKGDAAKIASNPESKAAPKS